MLWTVLGVFFKKFFVNKKFISHKNKSILYISFEMGYFFQNFLDSWVMFISVLNAWNLFWLLQNHNIEITGLAHLEKMYLLLSFLCTVASMDVFIYYLFSHAVTINTRESPLAEVERRRPKEKKKFVKYLGFRSHILTLANDQKLA